MKYSIALRRKTLKITQQHLADACGCCRQRISDLENHKFYPSPEEKRTFARLLNCAPDDLQWRPQPTQRTTPQETQELLARFRHKASYRPPRAKTGESRLWALRHRYSAVMKELEPLLLEAVNAEYVDDASFDSPLETLKSLICIKNEDARPCEAAPQAVGFDLHPVVDTRTRRVVGHCPVPALVAKRWLAILQVTVLTPVSYTMDALICVIHNGTRYFFAMEIEGPGKPPPDPKRDKALGMRIIRFTQDEILRGVGINDKLDEILGYED